MGAFEPLNVGQFSATPADVTHPPEPSSIDLPELTPAPVDPNEDPAEKGFREGFQVGLQQVEEQTRSLLQALKESSEHFAAAQRQAGRELEDQAARLSVQLACNLADAHIEANPELIEGIARGALRDIAEADSATLYLHPEDFDMLDQELLAIPGQHLSLRVDHNLQRGGCRVESAIGDIDSTRQGRFDHLREKVEDLIKQREQ